MSWKTFAKRLIHNCWSKNEILLLKREKNLKLEQSHFKECKGRIVYVTEDNISDCGAFENPEHYIPVYRKMISNGDYVHFGYLNDDCVFRHAAQCSGVLSYDGVSIKNLKKGLEVYTHYAYCAPRARGMGFLPMSLQLFAEKFSKCDMYTMVNEDNISSLRGHFRVGYVPYMRIEVKNHFFTKRVRKQRITQEEATELVTQCYN